MKKSFKKQRLIAEINIAPFTDVILVLLVIFMISTPLIYQTSIKVKLPEAKSGEPTDTLGPGGIYIVITNEGVMYVNKEVVTKKDLRDKITKMKKNPSDVNVILRADRLVRFKDIVDVLDTLTALGITKLDIAVKEEG